MDFSRNLLSAKKKKDPYSPQSNKLPSLVTSVPPKQKSPHSELLLSWIGTIQMGTISTSSSQLVLLLPISVISLPCFFSTSVPMLPCLSAFGLAALINQKYSVLISTHIALVPMYVFTTKQQLIRYVYSRLEIVERNICLQSGGFQGKKIVNGKHSKHTWQGAWEELREQTNN